MGLLIAILLSAPVFGSVVLDRIAIVVDNQVIKDSDIERDIRITDFLNGERLDFSPAARKKAADHLIDQAIIRHEIQLGLYPEATTEETDKLLKQALAGHPDPPAYGITKDQLRRALHWQLTVLRFIDMRFKPVAQAAPKNTPAQPDPFVTWLDQTRKTTQITYREEDLK
jgi:hypothetical protein